MAVFHLVDVRVEVITMATTFIEGFLNVRQMLEVTVLSYSYHAVLIDDCKHDFQNHQTAEILTTYILNV